jgi:hypothetical protein
MSPKKPNSQEDVKPIEEIIIESYNMLGERLPEDFATDESKMRLVRKLYASSKL